MNIEDIDKMLNNILNNQASVVITDPIIVMQRKNNDLIPEGLTNAASVNIYADSWYENEMEKLKK